MWNLGSDINIHKVPIGGMVFADVQIEVFIALNITPIAWAPGSGYFN